MATILTTASGAWSAGGTWVGGVPPGTGDIAQIETTHTVTLTDNRQCFGIKFNGPGRTAFLIMNAGTILTFDDAVGAGWQDSSHDGSLTSNGTSGSHCKIQSAAAPPANFWRGEGNNKRLVLRATYTDFVDMAGQFALDEGSVWTTIATNCTFKRSGAGGLVDWGLRNSTRYVGCTFDHCDVHPYLGADVAFLDNCSGINGTTFLVSNQAADGLFASRTHNGVANDYRFYPNLISNPRVSLIQASDRPVPTDNVRIARDGYVGNALWFLWDVSLVINDLTVVSDNTEVFIGTYNAALQIATGVELVVRGTFTKSSTGGVYIPNVSVAGNGRMIEHASGGATYKIRCGTNVLKSALTEDFAAGNNVTIIFGKLTADNAVAHDNLTVEAKATLALSPGISWTPTAGKTVTVNEGGAITGDASSGSPITVKSSNPGSAFRFVGHRGTLLIGPKDARSVGVRLANVAPAGNYAIENIQHPCAAYFGSKLHLAYMTYGGKTAGNTNAWAIMTRDLVAGTWSGPYEVDPANSAEDDGHKYASIIADAAGFLHIFYDCHNEPLKHRKSNVANDVSGDSGSWTQQTDISTGVTYPNLARASDGTLYLMYRKNQTDTVFRKSTDNGATWSAEVSLTTPGAYDLSYPFGLVLDDAGTIHIFGSFRMNVPAWPNGGRDPWYMRSGDGGATWKKANGANYALPATPTTVDIVQPGNHYEGSGDVSPDGIPYMAYWNGGGTITPQQLWVARWTGTKWQPYRVSRTGEWSDWTFHLRVDKRGWIHVFYVWGTARQDDVTGEVIGDVYLTYAKSTDLGASWSYTNFKKWTGTPGSVYTSDYMNVVYLRDRDRLEIFWMGDPTNSTLIERNIMWEEMDPVADIASAPRAFVLKNAKITDCDASGGDVPLIAQNSVNGGRNTNVVFEDSPYPNPAPHAGM